MWGVAIPTCIDLLLECSFRQSASDDGTCSRRSNSLSPAPLRRLVMSPEAMYSHVRMQKRYSYIEVPALAAAVASWLAW